MLYSSEILTCLESLNITHFDTHCDRVFSPRETGVDHGRCIDHFRPTSPARAIRPPHRKEKSRKISPRGFADIRHTDHGARAVLLAVSLAVRPCFDPMQPRTKIRLYELRRGYLSLFPAGGGKLWKMHKRVQMLPVLLFLLSGMRRPVPLRLRLPPLQ